MKPPYAIGSVPSLSGHAIAYRWRSLPRVRQNRASKPQGSSERVLPWQITMDQLIFASLSQTHLCNLRKFTPPVKYLVRDYRLFYHPVDRFHFAFLSGVRLRLRYNYTCCSSIRYNKKQLLIISVSAVNIVLTRIRTLLLTLFFFASSFHLAIQLKRDFQRVIRTWSIKC